MVFKSFLLKFSSKRNLLNLNVQTLFRYMPLMSKVAVFILLKSAYREAVDIEFRTQNLYNLSHPALAGH